MVLAQRVVHGLTVLGSALVYSANGYAGCDGDLLACEGYAFEAVYTGEIWGNAAGGMRRGAAYLDNLDLTLEIDAERAWGWTGATFFAYVLANTDDTLSEDIVGDAQVVSNIDAIGAVRLFEFWYEQALWDERFSIKTGLYNLNSEFDANETGSLFINSSHGIGADFSQAGENGPSIFPVTSLALRTRLALTQTLSLQAVVLDGVPGDPDDPRRTAIILSKSEGALIAVEADYLDDRGTKLALGFWHFTARFDDVLATDSAGDPVQRSGNQGVYVLAERVLYREPESPEQGLAVFGRFGIADDDVNQFDRYLGVGGVYTGLVPGRDEDRLGLAVAIADNGDPFEEAQRLAGESVDSREINVELTYRLQVTPWLALQPDIQYVADPGAAGGLGDAWVFGLRFEASYSLPK